ncbi:MAG: 1-acyl-sn-glycerol-3-phosphate acyltransferase [Desulfomonilia bacterium]
MITDILYRCPVCGGFDWLREKRCISCNARVEVLSRSRISINGRVEPLSTWYAQVRAYDLKEEDPGIYLRSGQVRLSREKVKGRYAGFAGITATHYGREPLETGTLTLKPDEILFSSQLGDRHIPLRDITSITIESNTIIIISRTFGVMFFDFLEESGKKWEDCIQKALARIYDPDQIVEYYPRIRLKKDLQSRPAPAHGHRELRMRITPWYPRDYSLFFAILRRVVRPIVKILFSVDVKGLENIPSHGSAIVLLNHTSFLDSIVFGVFPKRYIWFMAKNSEYRNGFMNWFLRHARSFPVRRYTVDAQAIRNAIRIVQQGHVLGIFPEGERTWDGSLLPFRTGTIRLVLALGIPVIPVGISGAYELMPRWTSSIKRSPVRIRVGSPLIFDKIPVPKQTWADIESASGELRRHLSALLEERV